MTLDPDPLRPPEPLTQADILAMSDEEFGRFVRDIGLEPEVEAALWRYLAPPLPGRAPLPSRRPYRLAGLVLGVLSVALVVAIVAGVAWAWGRL